MPFEEILMLLIRTHALKGQKGYRGVTPLLRYRAPPLHDERAGAPQVHHLVLGDGRNGHGCRLGGTPLSGAPCLRRVRVRGSYPVCPRGPDSMAGEPRCLPPGQRRGGAAAGRRRRDVIALVAQGAPRAAAQSSRRAEGRAHPVRGPLTSRRTTTVLRCAVLFVP